MSEFTFRLVLLFFPGIISALIVEKLVTAEKWPDFRFALYSLVLGFTSYLLYAIGLALKKWNWPPSVLLIGALGDKGSVHYQEILIVTAICPLVAFVVSFLLNHHWLNRLAKLIRISKRFGDRDVWSYTFNSSDVTDNWVVVRDFDQDLAFEGWVNAFAETSETNELLLSDVKVFRSSDSHFLYDVDSLYLTRQKDHLTIEFRRSSEQSEFEENPNG